MVTFNGVVGIDEAALQLFVADFYECARKSVFHKVVSVSSMGFAPLESIEYDVTTMPKVTILPSPASTSGSSTARFDLTVDHFTLALQYSGGVGQTTLDGVLNAQVDLVVDAASGQLLPRLTSATLNIAGEEKLSEIFNKVVSPHLDRFLQEKLLDPLRIPVLTTAGVSLSWPTVAADDNRLLATTAIAPAVAAPAPLNGPWPAGRLFMGADFVLVNALAAAQMPKLGTFSGEWKKTIKFFFGQSTIKATYNATVTSLKLAPVPGQPTQLEGAATVVTNLAATAKNLFNVRGTATSKATVTAEAIFDQSNGLGVRLTGVRPFSISFSFPGGAAGFGAYATTVANSASATLREQISATLRSLSPFEVGTLPSFTVPIGDDQYLIQIKEPAIRVIEVAGLPLLSATAVPDVEYRP